MVVGFFTNDLTCLDCKRSNIYPSESVQSMKEPGSHFTVPTYLTNRSEEGQDWKVIKTLETVVCLKLRTY